MVDLDQDDLIRAMLVVNFSDHTPSTSERDQHRAAMNPNDGVVAVVDDDAAVCDSTRLLLEVYDFGVRTYQSGAEFLTDDPDIACLIVDYQMPGLDGLQFVSELRKRGSQVPTIMITATTDPSVERRAAALGIKRVLKKPLSSQMLLSAIREELQ
jgi:two-component system, LuxR family, response regulator FixJ